MTHPHFSQCGTNALLMDVSEGKFSLETQQRLWSLCRKNGKLARIKSLRNVMLGVNNVLVTYHSFEIGSDDLQELMIDAWNHSVPDETTGVLVDVPVVYDKAAGSELEMVANNADISIENAIALHTSVEYHVACIGSVPGFAYLVGLPFQLITPRRATPRARVPKGSVAIGGAQTGVIPMDMPSGWNLVGSTSLSLFDPLRDKPSLLSPGDRVRFISRISLQ